MITSLLLLLPTTFYSTTSHPDLSDHPGLVFYLYLQYRGKQVEAAFSFYENTICNKLPANWRSATTLSAF